MHLQPYLIVASLYLALGPFSACGLAHPFHTSVAEIEWNAQTRRWEIGLRIYANDLQKALRHIAHDEKIDHAQLNFEESETVEFVRNYLARHFVAVTADGLEQIKKENSEPKESASANQTVDTSTDKTNSVSHIKWVGHKTKGSWIWLFFELVPEDPEHRFVVVRRFLSEVNPDQINAISVRNGKQRLALQINLQQPWITFDTTLTEDNSVTTPK